VIVPAATRIYEKRRARLGVATLRPWDTDVDPLSRSPLHPFEDVKTLDKTTASIFHNVDPQLGEYYAIMQREGLLDLENRKGKAPGGYCTGYSYSKRPFIFMNAVGMHNDVQTLLHEGGHAFHVFECAHLNKRQLDIPIEFVEVASMSMERWPRHTCWRQASRRQRRRATNTGRNRAVLTVYGGNGRFQHWVYTHLARRVPAN
jgi:oligoendopeptidase F